MPAQVIKGYPNILQKYFKQQEDLWLLSQNCSDPDPAEVLAHSNMRQPEAASGVGGGSTKWGTRFRGLKTFTQGTTATRAKGFTLCGLFPSLLLYASSQETFVE